jgi:hypothetical protein
MPMLKPPIDMTEGAKKLSVRPQRCLMYKQIPVLGLKALSYEAFSSYFSFDNSYAIFGPANKFPDLYTKDFDNSL